MRRVKTEFAKKKRKKKKKGELYEGPANKVTTLRISGLWDWRIPSFGEEACLLFPMVGELCLGNASATKIFVNLDIPETQEFKIRQADDEGPVELLAEMESSQFQLNSTGDHQFGRAR
ncbi:glutamate receptor 2.7-like protein [Corchorus capsularis]|uniref:Glutamate receptor 2.7-like protein n=1 Tax=Corchorus capsularis TaxID=210143 RepID=A0A1R3JSY7_COCAP|nr:glutamate receptor 2.7-like protein [Corchorus capsularis]